MIHNYYWNPWKGCHKISEGCHNCFMFYQSSQKGIDPEQIIKSDDDFDLPIQINDNGEYKIPSGSILRVCMNSDFFFQKLIIGVKQSGISYINAKTLYFSFLPNDRKEYNNAFQSSGKTVGKM